MKLLKIITTALVPVVFLLASFANPAVANERYGQQKVVYHVNYPGGPEDKKWQGAMRNIQNHINAVGAENMDIKVVLHGNGVAMLASAKKNETLQSQILSLKGQEVNFHVCANTLKGRKISYENDLLDVYEEDIVPSGVAELSHLQQQGYTYIKP